MMQIFFGCLRLGFVRLARRPGRLLGLLLLPLAVLAAGLLLPPASLDQPLEAGVCLPDGSPGAQALFAALGRTDARYVIFHEASEQEIRDQVAAGRWECGFVLREDFEDRYPEDDPGRLATMVRSRASTLSPLLSDTFAAALFHVRAPHLAAAYAAENGLAAGEALDALREAVASGLAPDERMALDVQTLDGTAGTSPDLGAATARAACRGLIAVFLFLYALLLAADLAAGMRDGWFVRTAALAGRFPLLLGQAAAGMLAASVCGLLAYGLSEGFFAPGGAEPTGFAAILVYAFMLTGLALALGQIPGAHHVLAALLPFIPAACLILCPILFDAGRFFPPAAPVSAALPPTWLLRALDGGGLHVLLAAGAACALAAFACAHIPDHS